VSPGLIVAYLIILGVLLRALCHIYGIFRILTDMQRAEEDDRKRERRGMIFFFRTR